MSRVVVVTGGRGGIGAAIVEAFRADGASVWAIDRSGDGVREIAADLTRSDEIRAAVARIVEAEGRIDALVNAAGVNSFGAAATLDEAEWDRVIDINLKGVFLACQAAIPALRASDSGRIVNIGSVVGKNGGNARAWIDRAEQDGAANVAYGASKAGVHALTLFLARELAVDGITVNAVAPGPIASAMTASFPDRLKALIPVGRMGTAADVARAVVFLAGPDTGFITGEILDVNGGLWAD